jgi:hypothetical protein
MDNLELFRKNFLEPTTWTQRKDGVPLYLLDSLSPDELKTAEKEMIKAASIGDDWSIIGLGHIKSIESLPMLYSLLSKSKKVMTMTIAHAIFGISQDEKMKSIVLECMSKISDNYELISVLWFLPEFKDQQITALLHSYRNHKDYLVAYNATRYLGLPTDEIVEKFRNKNRKSFWNKLLGR